MPPAPITPDGPGPEEPELRIVEPACAVFRRKLRDEGLKYTPERAMVLDTIVRRPGVFEAEHLLDELRHTGLRVSKATIYRTLKLLMEAGVIERVLVDADASKYQLARAGRRSEALVRMDTDEVIALDVPELSALRDRLCRERGLTPQGHRFVVYAVGPQAPARG